MSSNILEQYLKVVPTLGITASQTQFVNNVKSGYTDSVVMANSVLNLLSTDGTDRAVINMVSKSGHRFYAGSGMTDANFAASTGFAEFKVNSSIATLHVPELNSAIMHIGALGTASNAATMSYLTVTNAGNSATPFQQVGTTANYLELTSADANAAVAVAGTDGLMVESYQTNAFVTARTGNLNLFAAAGKSFSAQGDAGMSFQTSAGDFSLDALVGAGSITTEGLLEMSANTGNISLAAVSGNTFLSAAQALTANAADITLNATSSLSLITGGDFTQSVSGNVNIQSTADSVNLSGQRYVTLSSTLRDITASVTTGYSFPGVSDTGITVAESATEDEYLYTSGALTAGSTTVNIQLRFTHDGTTPMSVDALAANSFVTITYPAVGAIPAETLTYTVGQESNSVNSMSLYLYRDGNRIGSAGKFTVTWVSGTTTAGAENDSKVFNFTIAAFQEGVISLDAKGGVNIQTESGEVRLDSGDSISMTASDLIVGRSNVDIQLYSGVDTSIQTGAALDMTVGTNLTALVSGSTNIATTGALISTAASSNLYASGASVYQSGTTMLLESLAGDLSINAEANRLLLTSALDTTATSGANIYLDAAQNFGANAIAGTALVTSSLDATLRSVTANVNATAVAGTVNISGQTGIVGTAATGNVAMTATTGSLVGTATQVGLTATSSNVTVTAQTGMFLESVTSSIALTADAGSLTGDAMNITWTTTDGGSPFVVRQHNSTLLVGASELPGDVAGNATNTQLFVQGNSVFYGDVDIRGSLNRIITQDVILNVTDKIITLSSTDANASATITNYDQHNSGLQLSTPTGVGYENDSKYFKWLSSGSGPSEEGYLKAFGVMDTGSDASRWVLRGGDLWIERSVTDLSNTTANVAFGFVITKDLRLALVRRTGTIDGVSGLGPASSSSSSGFSTLQFFGTPIV